MAWGPPWRVGAHCVSGRSVPPRTPTLGDTDPQRAQEWSACRARAPQDAPASAQRDGSPTTASASAHNSSSTGWSTARTSASAAGSALDAAAHSVGGEPQLLARELQRDEWRRPGGRAREGRHVDAGAGAPGGQPGAQGHAIVQADRELGDHGRGRDAQVAHVHADAAAGDLPARTVRRRMDRPVAAGRPPRPGAVVPQVPRRGGRCQPAGRDGREETSARRQADVGVPRVLAEVAETTEVLARGEAVRGTRPLGSEREPIGNGGAAGERSDRVVGAGRLEDVGVGGIGNEERRVVGLLMRCVRDATLPARLEQPGHHVDRLGGAAGALEPETDEVHSDQRRLCPRRVVGRGDTLIADGHAVLVHAVLGPPQPRRTREQRGVRTGVPDGEVLRAQGAARRGPPAEGPGDLHLTGRSVGVLGEHHARRTGGAQGVAHGRSVRRLAIVSVRAPTCRADR